MALGAIRISSSPFTLMSVLFALSDWAFLSTTIAFHVDFRGRCVICTWQPKKELL